MRRASTILPRRAQSRRHRRDAAAELSRHARSGSGHQPSGGASFAERYESLSSGRPRPSPVRHFPGYSRDEPASSLRATLAEAEAVSSLLAQRLRDGDKPGDFALLMRAMTKAPLYVAALAARGVPCILGGGGALYEQAEVVDLLHLLGWLIHPQDALAARLPCAHR